MLFKEKKSIQKHVFHFHCLILAPSEKSCIALGCITDIELVILTRNVLQLKLNNFLNFQQ